ncbi:hypothetical protein [Bacteroides sp.]|nr:MULTISPECIES: hypothetical protein [Bacteroides]
MMKKKRKKSNWIVGALLIYTTLVAFYFLVFVERQNTMEEYLTIGFSYLIILILWFVLRKKEKYAQEREKEMGNPDKK